MFTFNAKNNTVLVYANSDVLMQALNKKEVVV